MAARTTRSWPCSRRSTAMSGKPSRVYFPRKFNTSGQVRSFSRNPAHVPPTGDQLIYCVPQISLLLNSVGLGSVDFLSIDVFDTAISRRHARPTEIFRVMQPAASALVGRDLTDFESQRVNAEREARGVGARDRGGCREITLDKIE